MDWISLPVACGKEIVSKWLMLNDTAKMDAACCSQAARSTFREWCDDTTLMLGCLEDDIGSQHLSTILLWLLERRLNLDRIGVLVDGSGDIAALHRYLLARGGTTTDIAIFFAGRQLLQLDFRAIKVLLRDLPRTCPRVTGFQLTGVVDDECLAILAPFLPQLTSFYSSHSSWVTSAGLASAARHFRNLTSFALEGIQVGDDVLLTIANSCPGLTSMSILDHTFTNEGYLAALPKLRALEDITVDFPCSTELAQMICQHPCIVSVTLQDFTNDVLTVIFKDNDKLQDLRIYAARDASIAVTMFDHVKGLQRLDFTGECVFTIETALTIARNNPGLRTLSLHTSGGFAGEFLATVLSGCSQLQDLTLLRGSIWAWSDMGRMLDAALLKAYPQLRHVRVETHT